MACLRLSLLGAFQAELDGEPVTGFATNKIQALLAYLAVEAHRAHRREVLAALLWPDWPEREARTNLRNALSKLRIAIGDRAAMGDRQAGAGACQPYLRITRETVQFNVDSDHWLDVAAFRDLVATEQEGDAACDRLQRAIALYRGPFLEGFSVGDSRAFEDWAFLVRERLERRVLAALQRLIGHCERWGKVARASELAWRWVELAPWQERAHQALMRCLALSGQRGAALARYEACRRALKEELDVEPGEETARLYERIRDGELTPAPQKAQAREVPFTVVSEPAPAPAAAALVDAPVAAKKGLPGWVWGVIGAMGTLVLLIAAGAALLAPRGEAPSSIPEATTLAVATSTPLALAAVTSAPRATIPAGTGHIAGTVTDESGSPVAGIWVEACEESVSEESWGTSTLCGNAVTDENGGYAIPQLPPGKYRLVIWGDPSFVGGYYDHAPTYDDADLLPVTGGRTTPGIDFALVPAMSYWVEPQEGKFVDLCKDVTPPQICIRDVETGQLTQVTSDLDFGQVGGPGWSPDGQQILFAAGLDPEVTGWWDHKLYLIYVKEPLQGTDRSDLRQITSGNTNDLDPAWSPDGQWIVFHRNCGLWIVRPDGAGAQMLLAATKELCTDWPAWSPDSRQIAFSNTRAPFIELWVIDADGSDPHVVYTFERRLEWGSPAWSPDGQQIACRYSDGREEKTLLILADGRGEPQIVDQSPGWWVRGFWPQWGGEREAPPIIIKHTRVSGGR